MAQAKRKASEISIQKIHTGILDVCILGTTPLLMNRAAEKAWRELLLPAPPKNRAAKQSMLKHNPVEEYRASVYQSKYDDDPTALLLPVQCFKAAATTAALDLPGTSKAQIGRLMWIVDQWVPVYGVPQLSMMMVRQAGINRTPDVRTRAIIPQWAARLRIEFVQPILTHQSIINLLAAGGLTAGVGDFRQEKGKGNYGQFNIVDENHERFVRILAEDRREAQLAALETPVAYDGQTEELLSWFDVEVNRRGIKAVS